jgi:hypothetical protein
VPGWCMNMQQVQKNPACGALGRYGNGWGTELSAQHLQPQTRVRLGEQVAAIRTIFTP